MPISTKAVLFLRNYHLVDTDLAAQGLNQQVDRMEHEIHFCSSYIMRTYVHCYPLVKDCNIEALKLSELVFECVEWLTCEFEYPTNQTLPLFIREMFNENTIV